LQATRCLVQISSGFRLDFTDVACDPSAAANHRVGSANCFTS
jgi:hypothetical protein